VLAWVPKKVQHGRFGWVGHVEFLEKFARSFQHFNQFPRVIFRSVVGPTDEVIDAAAVPSRVHYIGYFVVLLPFDLDGWRSWLLVLRVRVISNFLEKAYVEYIVYPFHSRGE